jgi:hypothetical protein
MTWDEARWRFLTREAEVGIPRDARDLIARERGYRAPAHEEPETGHDGMPGAIAVWLGSRDLGAVSFDVEVACFFAGERGLVCPPSHPRSAGASACAPAGVQRLRDQR